MLSVRSCHESEPRPHKRPGRSGGTRWVPGPPSGVRGAGHRPEPAEESAGMHSRSSSSTGEGAPLGRIRGGQSEAGVSQGRRRYYHHRQAQLTAQQATRKATSSRSARLGSSWEGPVCCPSQDDAHDGRPMTRSPGGPGAHGADARRSRDDKDGSLWPGAHASCSGRAPTLVEIATRR